MRFVYPYLVLAVLLACEGESGQPTTDPTDTNGGTATGEPPSTTSAAEQPTSTTTETGEPNSADQTTTGDSSTTGFTGTEAVDTDEPVGSSTTLFTGTTDDTDGSETAGPAETTIEPEHETEGGGNTQPCVGAALPVGGEAIAYLESQIGEGEGEDPELLHVRFASQSFTCDDPHERLACGHNWEVALRIPVEYQVPGVYALADGLIDAIGVSNGGGQGDDVCEEAGGAASGTLEIDAIDGTSVIGRICHLRAFGLDGWIMLDGTFVAPRCPQ